MKPKKHLGQNFLKDEFYLNQIIESASKLRSDITQSAGFAPEVVEIGVGLGDLSAKLLNHFDLIAYEIDAQLCEYLADKIPNLINKDVLEIPLKSGWLCEMPYILVSNLPYYIATKIILNALKDDKCAGFVVMTQKEVAEKFCASVGDSEFCALSVMTQTLSKSVHLVANVPPSAFTPPPKVESSVFCVEKNDKKWSADFEKMLKIAFSAPRKRAMKNLESLLSNGRERREIFGESNGKSSAISAIFADLGISQNARAHQISTENYQKIFIKMKGLNYGQK
ncbi:16S rRNA (adenine(1518)-N(6)/adenine(1519)-N(6))-dimethyltransferase RsmA [Helicobacter sp. 23-1045]